ncbi:MAG: hypothetical protein N3A60_11430, partial [Thermanaerothrix sp.]|nr:hypothetical protein [Thermanaerothrix sp.]
FRYVFRHDPNLDTPTEIFIPAYQYPQGVKVDVSDGTYEIDSTQQILRYSHTPHCPIHEIRIRPSRTST